MLDVVANASLAFAAIPAVLFFRNLTLFRTLPGAKVGTAVSVLIPARNEEDGIAEAVHAALASTGVSVEVIVLDDHSDDRTAEIVQAIARSDSRVSLVSGPTLPSGWCGKQHACHVLARHASFDLLCFVDADVRLAPDALLRMSAHMHESRTDLLSGFPRQITLTFMERLLIPLIHFVLLGYLPLDGERRTRMAAFAAGCGQLMMVRRGSYEAAGGHGAIGESLHDGIRLPKLFRSRGLRTHLFNATDLASCRMYRNAGEVWNGLRKNATEGMAAPGRIGPFTFLLLMGQVAPFILLSIAAIRGDDPTPLALACGMVLIVRLIACLGFHQPLMGAVLHPLGILLLLAIQWQALLDKLRGRGPAWRGRSYGAGEGEPAGQTEPAGARGGD